MTYLELKKRAAKELNLLDSTDNFLTGRDITQAQLGDSINDAYLHDVVGGLAEQYPMLFEIEAYSPNYVSTSTITTIVGTTLTTTDIFLNSHVGCNVYNSTRQNYATIDTYTSGLIVELSIAPSDWVTGDTIYLLEKDYTFGGDATDYIEHLSLEVRYSPTSSYIPSTLKMYDDAHITGFEDEEQDHPIHVLRTFATNNGFSIAPNFTSNDSKAIRMRYLQMPIPLDLDVDVPKLPLNYQSFLYWRAVEEGAIARKDTGLATYAQQKYEQGRSRLLASFRPLRNLKPQRNIQTHYKYIKNKDY